MGNTRKDKRPCKPFWFWMPVTLKEEIKVRAASEGLYLRDWIIRTFEEELRKGKYTRNDSEYTGR